MDNNQQPLSPTEIAQKLQQEWLAGQGRVTQLPGTPAASTRKFYNRHKGYDIGVKAGTPVYAPSNLQVKDMGVQGGYGRRLAAYDPNSGQTYYLSHLSDVASQGDVSAGSILGYTGGTPGSYGAGNTTGAHIDFEIGSGDAPPSFAQQIAQQANTANQTTGANYSQQLLQRARQQNPNIRGIARDPNKLREAAGPNAKIVKITL